MLWWNQLRRATRPTPAMAPDPATEMIGDAIVVDDTPQRSSQRSKPPSAKARESRGIEDVHEKPTAAGTKAAKRAPRSTTANGNQPEYGKNVEIAGAEAAGWQKVLELVGKRREVIVQQQVTIQDLHERLKGTQAELKQVRD